MKIKNIEDVAAWQICCGCGACAYISPDGIEMIDSLEFGRRPRFRTDRQKDPNNRLALEICPGVKLARTCDPNTPGLIKDLFPAWGPVLEIWEGYAADPEIRYQASSGGIATALGLYAIEKSQMDGVLHIKARPDVPYLNHTVLSNNREQLLAGAGSRYAPASPCDGLNLIENAHRPCVFIGKPCDVAAVHKILPLRLKMKEKVGLTIAFFCAGTPTTFGTFKMFQSLGIENPNDVKNVRYRGQGWPGMTTVTFLRNGTQVSKQLTYEQSWGGILEKYRQWRCYICADHTGELADVSVADAWHRSVKEEQPGLSVIIARSERGRKFLQQARDAGYLVLEPGDSDILPACRPGQITSLGALWGRLVALKILWIPTPNYKLKSLFRFWRENLNIRKKIKSVLGTIKRAFRKKLYKKQKMRPWTKAHR